MCVSGSISGVGHQIFTGAKHVSKEVVENCESHIYAQFTLSSSITVVKKISEVIFRNKLKKTTNQTSQK
jgi:hypothetical protein